jgi:LPXTG-motif cell wall-anchored protein
METPKNDPIPIQLYKYDATDPDNLDSSSVLAKNKLEGAIFKLEYFDNEDGKTTGGAKRTWYFMTDEDGYLDTNDLSYLAPNGTQIKDSNGKVTETVSNSAFYKDADGNTTWPIGTYRYTEVQAPSCYVIDGTISVLDDSGKVTYTSSNPLSQGIVIRAIPSDKDTSAHRVDFFVGDSAAATSLAVSNALKVGFSDEEQSTGKITIKKVDENGKALSNVTFKLAGENGDELTGTTNSAGVVEFKDVTPQIYRITEISTRDGKSLLTDAITISYPYTFTEEELTSYGISKTTAQYDNVTGTWQLYDLSFTISNDLVFELPMTGGDGVVQKVAAGAALFAVLLGGAYLVIRKRRAA